MPKSFPSAARLPFAELVAIMGARTDSPAVLAFAEKCGAKTPLKPTTDGNSTQYFTVKKPAIDLAWTHVLRTPTTYPPQKENRHYVSYLHTIWFNLADITGLPTGIEPNMSWASATALPGAEVQTNALDQKWVRYPLPNTPLKTALNLHYDEDTGAVGARADLAVCGAHHFSHLRSSVVSHAFTPWHPSWPKEQADLPIGMVMAWAILRGEAGERLTRDHATQVEAVRARRMTGREFLYACAQHNEVWSTDFSPRLNHFLYPYILCLCHRNSAPFGRKERCNPDDDFVGLFGPLLPEGALLAADDWANYDRFARLLDARFRDWEITKLETDLSAEQEKQLKPLYHALQKDLANLPPPAAMTTDSSR
jgi:hypothetical protein